MPAQITARARGWSAVFALSLGAFALVASEFMPVSLLTPIAGDLSLTEGRAGQAIALSGGFAMATSLLLTRLAGRIDRKHLLLGLMLLMAVSGITVAFAPNPGIFMVARAFVGICVGGFWSMSAAVAMRLVSDDEVPKALSVINGGNALASVLAAPLGSFLGGLVGWRWAFFSLVPVAIAALIWQAVTLPKLPAQRIASRAPWSLFSMRPVRWGLVAAALFFMGQFALFTYLRPYLELALHAGPSLVSALLLGLGVAGFIGTLIVGGLLNRWLYWVLTLSPFAMAIVAIALAHTASVGGVAALLVVWGGVAMATPAGWWTWLARTLPDDAEAGGGLMVAIVQLAITLGATLGGVVFDAAGYRATFLASAVVLLAASLGAASLAWRFQGVKTTAAMLGE